MKPVWILIAAAASAIAAPTFNQDVAPILYENCATCHRPGEVAPFPLLTFQDAAKRAALIAVATEKRFMPPWKPEPGYGEFAHERRLTDAQIATLAEWAKAGAPEGDGKPPTPPVFPEGWQAGQPNLILKMPDAFQVPADGPDLYECFVLPTNLSKDVYVGGAEFRPGNPRIVHHAVVMIDTTGRARAMAKANGGSSYPCFGSARVGIGGLLSGWAPGAAPQPVEQGIALRVEKGADIVVQLHYHPSGKPERDQSQLGLRFSEAPTKGVATLIVLDTNIHIPAGETDYLVKATMTMPQDGDLFAIAPHAHYLAKEMKLTAFLPDGSTKPLMYIKDWDFNWQGQYRYKQPVHLPKGTRIDMEYSFDNSTGNPQNPSNPPKPVKWGEQTTDEMAVAFMGFLLPKPADVLPFQRAVQRQMLDSILTGLQSFDDLPNEISPATAQRIRQALVLFDRNRNGKLDPEERSSLQTLLDVILPRQ
ncbi:MAG: ascorbate-dependent monooxygenase [Acidobacteriota bacterium]